MAVVIHPILPLSLTFDHRAVTGGEAPRSLRRLVLDLQLPEIGILIPVTSAATVSGFGSIYLLNLRGGSPLASSFTPLNMGSPP